MELDQASRDALIEYAKGKFWQIAVEQKCDELLRNPTENVVLAIQRHAEGFSPYELSETADIRSVMAKWPIQTIIANELGTPDLPFDDAAETNRVIALHLPKGMAQEDFLEDEGKNAICADLLRIPPAQYQPVLFAVFEAAYEIGLLLSMRGIPVENWDTAKPSEILAGSRDNRAKDGENIQAYALSCMQKALQNSTHSQNVLNGLILKLDGFERLLKSNDRKR